MDKFNPYPLAEAGNLPFSMERDGDRVEKLDLFPRKFLIHNWG
jgi:hypothetical protein